MQQDEGYDSYAKGTRLAHRTHVCKPESGTMLILERLSHSYVHKYDKMRGKQNKSIAIGNIPAFVRF